MNNVSYIYQPHFKSNCFRVAINDQQGINNNYIVVTCSPHYNGVWRYPADNVSKYDVWYNGKVACYCVPIKDCTLMMTLDKLVNPDDIKKVKRQQKKWYMNKVTNMNYEYKNKPEWML